MSRSTMIIVLLCFVLGGALVLANLSSSIDRTSLSRGANGAFSDSELSDAKDAASADPNPQALHEVVAPAEHDLITRLVFVRGSTGIGSQHMLNVIEEGDADIQEVTEAIAATLLEHGTLALPAWVDHMPKIGAVAQTVEFNLKPNAAALGAVAQYLATPIPNSGHAELQARLDTWYNRSVQAIAEYLNAFDKNASLIPVLREYLEVTPELIRDPAFIGMWRDERLSALVYLVLEIGPPEAAVELLLEFADDLLALKGGVTYSEGMPRLGGFLSRLSNRARALLRGDAVPGTENRLSDDDIDAYVWLLSNLPIAGNAAHGVFVSMSLGSQYGDPDAIEQLTAMAFSDQVYCDTALVNLGNITTIDDLLNAVGHEIQYATPTDADMPRQFNIWTAVMNGLIRQPDGIWRNVHLVENYLTTWHGSPLRERFRRDLLIDLKLLKVVPERLRLAVRDLSGSGDQKTRNLAVKVLATIEARE